MNSKSVGERSEGLVLAKMISLGFAVSIPFGNNQRYDAIVDDGAKLLKAQVKTGRVRNGTVVFDTCSTNGFTGKHQNYRGQVDIFLVYCPDNDRYYKIPVEDVGIKLGSLRFDELKTSRSKGIKWAKDYEI